MTKESTIARIAAARPVGLTPAEEEELLARIMATPRDLIDDLWGDRRQGRPAHKGLLVAAGMVVVAACLAGIALAVSGTSSPRPTVPKTALRLATPGHPRGSTVQARLLTALNDASSDVVESRIAISDGQTVDEWCNGAGTLCRFVDSGQDSEPPSEGLTTINASGTTATVLWPTTRTWDIEHGRSSEPEQGLSPSAIEAQVQSGVLAVVGPGGMVDGHDTTELASSVTRTIEHLWVDSSTYLPIRLTLAPSDGVSGPSSQQYWTYYAATPQALSELTMQVPPGYTRTSGPPATLAPSSSGSGS